MRNFYKILNLHILFLWFISTILITDNCYADNDKIRAVSLTAFQEKLQEFQSLDRCPEKLLHFAHLTTVTGYIIDSTHNDLIIIGKSDPDKPTHLLEDFVIALRSAWNKYESHGNPLCSIDPDPEVMGQLRQVAEKLMQSRTPEQAEKYLQDWHLVCKKPQKVRIKGIPFHSHFAHIMVKADYDMKSIVNGSDSLAISGFQSLMDIMLNKVRQDIFKSKTLSIPISMNRFWFYPGNNRYQEDEGILLVNKCPVTLLTEQMYLAEDELIGAGKKNTLAAEFAEKFTANFQKIANRRPVYMKLEGLFRLVALTEIIKFRRSELPNDFGLDYLLNKFPVAEYSVSTDLPGCSNVKRFTRRKEITGGYQEFYLWIPSCGGVDMNITITSELFDRVKDNSLSELREKIINSRPSPDTVYWDYICPLNNK